MTRPLTTLQKTFALHVWELSALKAALLKQVGEVERFHREAIGMAAMHGVRQSQLASISELTRARISQIIATTPVSESASETSQTAWQRALSHPQDHLKTFRRITTDEERDKWNAIFESIHGTPGNLGRPSHSG